ncbi:hypothetical protein [Streptomyces sp. col6]|uniref:hypothetical protein n=1 Tax=Streptomyces sp. col6 TaxID=2478958 RepID=UPI001CD0DD51|nr:hypothetical protein [Streptomyces sp. col6]
MFDPEVLVVVEPGAGRMPECLADLRAEVAERSWVCDDPERAVVPSSFTGSVLAVGAADGGGQTLHSVFQVLGGGDGRGVGVARGAVAGPREAGGRGRGASGAVTHGGAHPLEVDVTPRREMCGSLHAAQRSRTGATRSNHRRILDRFARHRTFSGIHH